MAGFSPLYPYSTYYGGFGGGFYQNRYSTPYFGMTGPTAYFDDYDSPPAPPYIVRLSGEFPATLILEFPAPATVWLNDKEVPGTPDAVLTSERMSELYESHVDVVRVHGRILVVGESTESGFNLDEPHHMPVAVDDHPSAH